MRARKPLPCTLDPALQQEHERRLGILIRLMRSCFLHKLVWRVLPDQATEGMPVPADPPPKRLTVMEPAMDVAASPAIGYALLGRGAKVPVHLGFHAFSAWYCMRMHSRPNSEHAGMRCAVP